MSIIIDMSSQEIAVLKQITQTSDDADAIIQAARQFVRLVRLRELKAASGNVEFEDQWKDLEVLETYESTPPR